MLYSISVDEMGRLAHHGGQRLQLKQSKRQEVFVREVEYKAPKTLKEAVSLLSKANGNARILAGGTDLIDQMRQRRRTASLIIDGKSIPDLNRLEYNERRGLRVGAALSCTKIANSPVVKAHYHAIQEACLLIGSVQIQNRAAVGGNFCNASPSADTIPSFIVGGARCVIAGPKGKREVLAEEFFKSPGQTVMAANELLVEIVVPSPPKNSSAHYLRFIPRAEMDIAVAGVASYIKLSSDFGECVDAKICLASVAPTPVRAKEAEAALIGKTITGDDIEKAAEQAVLAAKPISDVRGSAEYRKELVKVLTRRTLRECLTSLGQQV